jgi:glycopeptide antibiotics resistance protein
LYLIVAYYLVILPLPEVRDVKSLQSPGTKHFNLIPFKFVFNILKETKVDMKSPSTYKYLLTERAFLQVAFNAILLTPLGIYLRYYFKKNLKQTLVITFLVSLFFEITQLTALYGIYNAPYRIFDVDDLFLNTFGGYLGYIIAPVFTFFLPKLNELDKINPEELRVGYFRRLLAFLIDIFIVGLIPNGNDNILLDAIIYFVYFILIVYFTNGRTIGKWLTAIRVKGQEDKLRFKEVVIRYGTLYYIVFGGNKYLSIIYHQYYGTDIGYGGVIIFLVQFVFILLFTIHIILCALKKSRFFYEKISNTRLVVSRK